jgi:hypothetical protein
MYLFEILYLQDLIIKKLYKELYLRNLVVHIALGKRLQEMQIEYNIEDYIPAEKKSESFVKFGSRNLSSSTTLMSNICKEYRMMTLYDDGK